MGLKKHHLLSLTLSFLIMIWIRPSLADLVSAIEEANKLYPGESIHYKDDQASKATPNENDLNAIKQLEQYTPYYQPKIIYSQEEKKRIWSEEPYYALLPINTPMYDLKTNKMVLNIKNIFVKVVQPHHSDRICYLLNKNGERLYWVRTDKLVDVETIGRLGPFPLEYQEYDKIITGHELTKNLSLHNSISFSAGIISSDYFLNFSESNSTGVSALRASSFADIGLKLHPGVIIGGQRYQFENFFEKKTTFDHFIYGLGFLFPFSQEKESSQQITFGMEAAWRFFVVSQFGYREMFHQSTFISYNYLIQTAIGRISVGARYQYGKMGFREHFVVNKYPDETIHTIALNLSHHFDWTF